MEKYTIKEKTKNIENIIGINFMYRRN